MDNREVAWILLEIGKMVELRGDSKYAGQSYKRAARLMERSKPILQLINENKLQTLEGVGDKIAGNITEMVRQGHSSKLDRLREQVPEGVREIAEIPNISSQKAHLLHKELGIDTVDKLEKALYSKENIQRQDLLKLKGFGLATINDMKKGLELYKQRGKTFLLGLALPLAYKYVKDISTLKGIRKVEVVGEIRRMKETVNSVELLVECDAIALNGIKDHFPEVIHNDKDKELTFTGIYSIPVKVYLTSKDTYGGDKIIHTGSKEHVEKLKSLGFKNEKAVDENQVYDKLKIQYIAPYLREGARELTLAKNNQIPELFTMQDIKGDLHIHTHYSDGLNTVEEIIAAANKLNYQYIAITDHSQSLKIAKGLTKERILKQWKEIDKLQDQYDIRVFKGIEVDILADGKLDFDDDFLAQFDVVIASVHSHFKQNQQEMTSRIMRAVSNPHVDIIGHATGRLIQKRPAYLVDLEKVFKFAKDYPIAFEINSSPDRLDLNSENVMMAKDLGLKISINTDSHSTLELANILLGVGTGQRGYLEKGDILNCWDKEELLDYLRG